MFWHLPDPPEPDYTEFRTRMCRCVLIPYYTTEQKMEMMRTEIQKAHAAGRNQQRFEKIRRYLTVKANRWLN